MPGTARHVLHPQILVVDDDPHILELIAAALREDRYDVRAARSGAGARTEVGEHSFDLIVLDLMLPDADGLLLCNEFARLGIPVLVCSGSTRHRDGMLALRLGADGFISKPFDLEELSARVARILASRKAREAALAEDPRQVSAGNLRMDRKLHGVRVAEAEVEITPTEFRLLFALAKASGRVLTRSELAAAAWGYDDAADGRTIDVHVSRLKGKLKSASADLIILASRGEGYRLLSQLDQAA